MSSLDLTSILGSLSSEDFESLKNIASSFLGGGGKEPKEENSEDLAPAAETALNKMALPDMSKFASLAPILSELSKEDERTKFLMALKPFLSDERKSKADEAAKIVKIINLLPHLRESGIL
ncbi:MAG TPA: hypothetical protein VFC76_04120 [Oscillospiraceae bacterium]|nr:hypothetical protein [Oscillospiraceae bacterium]